MLEFIDYRLDNHPKYTIKECKERDATYAAPLYVTARLINKQTGEVKEQEIFMGRLPAHDRFRHLYFQRRRARHRQPACAFPRRVLCLYQGPRGQGPVHRDHEPPTAAPGWNMRPTPPMCSMSASTRTASCRSRRCCARSAFPPTTSSASSSAKTSQDRRHAGKGHHPQHRGRPARMLPQAAPRRTADG